MNKAVLEMKLFWSLSLALYVLLLSITVEGMENSPLENCLQETWGVDRHTARYISQEMQPLSTDHPDVIANFIAQSQDLGLDFSLHKPLHPLHPEDGVLQSPLEHLVLFENPYIRIFYSSTEPGAREPVHIHAWKSLLVIIKPTTYLIEYVNGTTEIGSWPAGVYELPAGEHYACTNIGPTTDLCLRFEVKD